MAFDAETTIAYLGTSRGYIISWDLQRGQMLGIEFSVSKNQEPVTSI